MHWFNHLHWLLHLLHSIQIIPVLASYQTRILTADASPAFVLTHALNKTSKTDYSNYLCTHEDSPSRSLPLGRDCDHIINHRMPPDNLPHEFYSNTDQDDRDNYQLPYELRFRSCAIVVDILQAYTTETSSWLTVRESATGVTRWCVYQGVGLGGSVVVGHDARMFVTVLGRARGTVEGNETTS